MEGEGRAAECTRRWCARKSRILAGLIGSILSFAPAAKGDPLLSLRSADADMVAEVVDGDTLILADQRQVRLVGLQAPKLPLGRKDFRAWPLAEEAKRALEDIAGSRRVSLLHGGVDIDRHGRVLAHLRRDDGLWIQGEMLRRGMARVYSFRDNRALVPEMLNIEAQARAARRGIWALPFYRIRDASDPGPMDSFQLIEGRVAEVAEATGRTYLNFGADWKTDFTAAIDARDRRLFTATGIKLADLKDKRVRLRGWLYARNGPMIDLTHPEQIELLE
jgi:micrococcal nuclease